jgi:hypothetical protein
METNYVYARNGAWLGLTVSYGRLELPIYARSLYIYIYSFVKKATSH